MKFRPIVAFAAAMLLTGAIWATSTGPAAAHDAFVGSDPAADSTLTEPPRSVSATFSADVVVLEGAVVLQVTGPNGDLISDGKPQVDGGTVTQPLIDHDTPGTYTVFWRIVGSDGHPIEGQFQYSLDPADSQPSTVSSTSSPTSTPTSTSATDDVSVDEAAADEGAPAGGGSIASLAFWFALVSIALLLAVGATMPFMMSRLRRQAQRDAQEVKDDQADPSDAR
ncbi:MAG: hypothetical protein BGO95_10620 [Micrococcales bacterium 73-13]|nr:MAG: hypothetical protein BGO95_10620 [Micrococcales bacterium 73-13]